MIINSSNIAGQSYYNLVQMCRITGYANPIGAFKATGEQWEFQVDANGNITSGWKKNELNLTLAIKSELI